MSNQILNSLIQPETSDTLYYASSSLDYILESINELNLAEVSSEAQQGLCSLLQCVSQAVSFEAYRTGSSDEAPKFHESLNSLEKGFIKTLCKHLNRDESSDSGPVAPPNAPKH